LRYKDKVTIVTGGSRGIGEGCVRAFIAEGSKVVFCTNQVVEGKALEATLKGKFPGEAVFVECDVTKTDDIQHLIDETVKLYGRIDCVINNAGWHPLHKTIDDFSTQDLLDLFELNVVSVFCCKQICTSIPSRDKGKHHQHFQSCSAHGSIPSHYICGYEGCSYGLH